MDSTNVSRSQAPGAFLADVNPELIDGVVGLMARKYRLSRQDAEDLRSNLWVKLLDRDGHVLRCFGGRSSLSTYLVRVASRMILDGFAARLGRWRPSAAVRRQGPAAVAWARMVERDGCTPDHARVVIREKRREAESDDPAAIAEPALTHRYRARRFVELTEIGELAATVAMVGVPSDGPLGLTAARRRVSIALRSALRSLTADERRLVRLRFRDGLRISDIARRERCSAVPLYRQYARILKKMRCVIGAAGVSFDTVACAFESPCSVSSSLEGRHQVVS